MLTNAEKIMIRNMMHNFSVKEIAVIIGVSEWLVADFIGDNSPRRPKRKVA